jgi:malate dehydrogenase
VPNILKRYEALKSGRTAGWTCAIGLAKIVGSIIAEDGAVLPCSAVLEGEYKQSGMSMSVPVILGRIGVNKILEYDLSEDEREGLKVSADAMKAAAAVVRNSLASM